MSNPFDQTFFKFLLGFSFILITSFAIIFVVTSLNTSLEKQEARVLSGYDMKDHKNDTVIK
jgi:hypothetical protein